MAKFKVTPFGHTWVDNFILHMLSAFELDKFGIKPRKKGDPDIEVDVVVTINGVEVPVEKFVEHMSSQYHYSVDRRAHELVKEKLTDTFEAIHDVLDTSEKAIKAKAKELFPAYDPDWQ